MQGTWATVFAAHGQEYRDFHTQLVQWASGVRRDTVAFSHFIAINALIGAAVGDDRVMIRSLDNASVTTLQVGADGRLTLIEGGEEANTLIR
jgi:broad specificity phosphatase PhoE